LSLDEIQQIAREVGIDPRYVQAAIAFKDQPPNSRSRTLLGNPKPIDLHTVIDGEIPEDELDRLVPVIRDHFGIDGSFDQVGRTLTWRSKPIRMATIHLTVSSRKGQTTLNISSRFGRYILFYTLISFYIGIVASIMTIGAAGLALLPGLAIAISVFGTLFTAFRLHYAWWSRRLQRNTRTLVGQIQDLVKPVVGHSVSMSGQSGTGRIEIEDVDEATETPEAREQRRKTSS
jgi:hypothetical protein